MNSHIPCQPSLADAPSHPSLVESRGNMSRRAGKNVKPLLYVYSAVVGILILVAGLAGLDWKLSMDEAKAQDQLAHAYETRAMMAKLVVDLTYAETAQRGYILTREASFMEAFKNTQQSVMQQLNAFDKSRFNDKATAELAVQMVDLMFDRLKKLVLSTQKVNQEGTASGNDYLVQGAVIMEQVRLVAAELRQRHQDRIDVLNEEHGGQIFLRRITILTLMLGIVILVVLLVWLVSVNLRHRDKIECQLRTGIARYEALFNGAMDALVIVNREGGIEALNVAALRMFNINRNDMPRNRHFATLLSEECSLYQMVLKDIRSINYGSGGLMEINAVRQDGTTFPVELAISEAEQVEGAYYFASFRDITERKRAEQVKKEFIATVSHELRTPLTSISGALKLAMHTFGLEMSAQCVRLLDIAERNTQRLIKLVNDILDIEKLEEGRMVFNNSEVILKEVVIEVIDAISPMARDKNVEIDLQDESGSVVLHIDALRLAQVLNNLLSNAIKFSPADTVVQVRLIPGELGVRIEVIDNGPGIPESFISQVFTKFSQATGPAYENKGGTGLGLSIVKEIVERMGGRINFTTSSEGSVFYIDLPVAGKTGSLNEQA